MTDVRVLHLQAIMVVNRTPHSEIPHPLVQSLVSRDYRRSTSDGGGKQSSVLPALGIAADIKKY